jgi:uncharacterized protein YabE (DUF348 family)
MHKFGWLSLILLVFLSGCQAAKTSATVYADGHVATFTTRGGTPADILSDARVKMGPNDCVLYHGIPAKIEDALPEAESHTLVIRRAVALTIIQPEQQKTIQSCAQNVGQAMAEAGFTLFKADLLDPPAETPIQAPLTVIYHPSTVISVSEDGEQFQVRSAAASVGQTLAASGFPLIGLDSSSPPENEPLPADGKVRITRIFESVSLNQKSIPFASRTELSADLEIDQQALVQGGEPGLAVTRLRTRMENGVQVSQKTESESIIRAPKDRILGYGTKVVIHTTSVDGQTIQYYRVLTLYATSYSPCRSATPDGRCSYGTSSGLPVQRGTVAMVYSWYLAFGFDKLYIPGYGYATVGDVGGGPPGNHYWIDLAFSDADYQPYSGTVTVYFLAPVPKNLVTILP